MKKVKNSFWLLFAIVMVGIFFLKLINRIRVNNIPQDNMVHIKAVIIDDKNYEPNDPVKPEFTYSYSFAVENKHYAGNSQDKSLKVGDTIEVVYDKFNPNLNRPLHSE